MCFSMTYPSLHDKDWWQTFCQTALTNQKTFYHMSITYHRVNQTDQANVFFSDNYSDCSNDKKDLELLVRQCMGSWNCLFYCSFTWISTVAIKLYSFVTFTKTL